MNRLDDAILLALADWRAPWLDRAITNITHLGSAAFISLIAAAGFAILWRVLNDRKAAVTLAIAAGGAEFWTEVLKRLFERRRPEVVSHLVEFTGFSFPSGHALAATATYGTLAVIACKYVRHNHGRTAIHLICWAIVFWVALSRVYLGVHYPTDVAAGLLLGSVWVYFTTHMWQGGIEGATSRSD